MRIIALSAVVATAFVATGTALSSVQMKPSLASTASSAVGRHVAVEHVRSTVQRFDLNSDTMYLDTFTYRILAGFPRRNTWRPVDDVEAFAVYTHELGHAVKGIVTDPSYTGPQFGPQDPTELAAECWAKQNRYRIARMMGFGPHDAREISQRATSWSVANWGRGFAQG